jgi:hypothetical protein
LTRREANVRRVLIALGAVMSAACQAEAPLEPLGLEVRQRTELGAVADAIRREAATQPLCPATPDVINPGWEVRTVLTPAGRVALPADLQVVTAPSGEPMYYAPDMRSGAFLQTAPGTAELVAENELGSGFDLMRCQVTTTRGESLVYLVSQRHPVYAQDSVHLAFLQFAGPGNIAIRAGAFATTRALRDSMMAALLAFQPEG